MRQARPLGGVDRRRIAEVALGAALWLGFIFGVPIGLAAVFGG